MDKKSDALLRKLLKNWVNRQRLPDNGRARLLWEVAHTSRNKIEVHAHSSRPQFKPYPSSQSNDWPQTLFSWINDNSFQFGLRARLS